MKLLAAVLGLTISVNLSGQSGVISTEELNVLYVGLNNPIKIAIPGVPANKTVIKTSHGILEKHDSVYYVLIPKREANSATITVGKLENGKSVWLYSKVFRIRNVPPSSIRLGALNIDDPIRLAALKVQSKIFAVIEGFAYEGIMRKVISYKFHIYSPITGFISQSVNNNSLNNLKYYLNRMNEHDMLILDSIQISGSDGSYEILGPFYLNFSSGTNGIPIGPELYFRLNSNLINLKITPDKIRDIESNNFEVICISPSNDSIICHEIYNAGKSYYYKKYNGITEIYNKNGDSTLTLQFGDSVSSGKALFRDRVNWDTTQAESRSFHLETTKESEFINRLFLHTKFVPIGYWETKLNDATIASGNIIFYVYQYEYFEDTSDYICVIIVPPKEHYLVHTTDFPILRKSKPKDSERVNTRKYCWYLKPGNNFHFITR